MKRPLAIAALILGTLTLPACGLTGDLKRPGPLWGDPANDVEAELPDSSSSTLPKLPPRVDEEQNSDSDDELLGGPEN